MIGCKGTVSRGMGAKPRIGRKLIAGRKPEFGEAGQLISIVQFEKGRAGVIEEKKKDVKPIVDVVISSNAEQNKNSFI